MTMREIADELGTSVAPVALRIDRWGIETRRPGPRRGRA
jgi:hypothetical protein